MPFLATFQVKTLKKKIPWPLPWNVGLLTSWDLLTRFWLEFKTVSTVLVLVAQWRRVLNWHTLQRTNISHLRKRKIIFKMPFLGDMLVPWRVVQRSKACFKNIWNIENQLHRRTLLNAEDQRGLLWVFKHVTHQNLGGGLKWSKMY